MTDKEIKMVDVDKCKYRDSCSNFCLAERDAIGETRTICTGTNCYFKQFQRKKAECEKLEEKWSIGFQKFCDKDNKLQHYKQALDEIEGLAKNFCKNCGDSKDCNDGKEGCYYSLIPDLFNSISKAKDVKWIQKNVRNI